MSSVTSRCTPGLCPVFRSAGKGCWQYSLFLPPTPAGHTDETSRVSHVASQSTRSPGSTGGTSYCLRLSVFAAFKTVAWNSLFWSLPTKKVLQMVSCVCYLCLLVSTHLGHLISDTRRTQVEELGANGGGGGHSSHYTGSHFNGRPWLWQSRSSGKCKLWQSQHR